MCTDPVCIISLDKEDSKPSQNKENLEKHIVVTSHSLQKNWSLLYRVFTT